VLQGSETDHVVYVLTGSANETRQLVYTAVTRGKKSVTLIGEVRHFKSAVERPPRKRDTLLRKRLGEALEGLVSYSYGADDGDGSSPAKRSRLDLTAPV
jgi:ATP-dependent exoDNAse (exonuclease V) alpha subunit